MMMTLSETRTIIHHITVENELEPSFHCSSNFYLIDMSEHPVLKEAIARYEEVFGDSPAVKVLAPGRENLIGRACAQHFISCIQ